jgi:phytoene dehydrogenase-like protein
VVIGGGIGGLVVAGRLAREGHNVMLLEKNKHVGGRCQSIDLDGYRFDTGPSLLLFKHVYERTFKLLGSSLEEHVEVRRVEPAAYRWGTGGSAGRLAAAHGPPHTGTAHSPHRPHTPRPAPPQLTGSSSATAAAQTCCTMCRR